MSTTIGHALCGLTCLFAARASNRRTAEALSQAHWPLTFAIVANLPDLDFLAGYLWRGNFHAFHGGPSHSLLAAAAMGVLVSLIVARPGVRPTVMFWLTLTALSHVLVDSCAGPHLGLHPSYGEPLLWPFARENLHTSVTLFYGVEHATLDRLLSWYNVKVIATEIATFSLPLLFLRLHLQPTDSTSSTRSFALGKIR